jgi:hypothetical protein
MTVRNNGVLRDGTGFGYSDLLALQEIGVNDLRSALRAKSVFGEGCEREVLSSHSESLSAGSLSVCLRVRRFAPRAVLWGGVVDDRIRCDGLAL